MNKRIFTALSSILICIFIFGIIYSITNVPNLYENQAKENGSFCEAEYKLQMTGVITDYSGFGIKSRPIILMLNDSIVKIPRYNTDMALYVGDTIIKQSSSHRYYIYRSSLHREISNKARDTIDFLCN